MSLIIFSNNLQYLMKQRGITQKDLETAMNIKEGRAYSWMNAKAYPRMEQMKQICDVLDFYDVFRMMTVNLKNPNQRVETGRTLPAHLQKQLKQLNSQICQVLAV